MKENIRSIVRHLLVPLAGLGGLLLSKNVIGPEDVEAANAAGASFADGLAVVIAGLAMWAVVKFFPNKITNGGVNGNDDGKASGGSGGMLPLAFFFFAVGALFMLPSCGSDLTGTVFYRDANTGAKGGLTFAPGKSPEGFIRVPIYDEETGELVGSADLSGPLSRDVDPASAK